MSFLKSEISFLSLNARGLKDNVKRKATFLFCKGLKAHCIFLQETHSCEEDMFRVHFVSSETFLINDLSSYFPNKGGLFDCRELRNKNWCESISVSVSKIKLIHQPKNNPAVFSCLQFEQ